MFIAELFTVTKMWKQCECSPMDEWINKVWCIHTVEYYLTLKKREGNSDTCWNMDEFWKRYAKWNKPVTNQPMVYDFTCIRLLNLWTQREWWFWETRGKRNGEFVFNGYSVSFWGDKVLESGDLWQWSLEGRLQGLCYMESIRSPAPPSSYWGATRCLEPQQPPCGSEEKRREGVPWLPSG